MLHTDRSRLMMLMVVAALTLCGGGAYTQDEDQPTNDLPNPYQTVAGWAKLPEGRPWGSTSAVDLDKDGRSIWVGERCGANTCARSSASRDICSACCEKSPSSRAASSRAVLRKIGSDAE